MSLYVPIYCSHVLGASNATAAGSDGLLRRSIYTGTGHGFAIVRERTVV